MARAQHKPLKVAEAAHVERAKTLPLWHWFGVVPATVEPSRPIRFGGSALVLGVGAGVAVAAGVMAAIQQAAGWWTDAAGLFGDLGGGLSWLLAHLTLGRVAGPEAVDYAAAVDERGGLLRCLAAAGAVALGGLVGGWAFRWGARPQVVGVKHVSGPQLLEGPEALADARRHAIQRKRGDQSAWPLFALPLLDDPAGRVWLPKDVWSRSALVYGSPGAGKTVAISPIVRALVAWAAPTRRRPRAKALIWDAKGDYAAAFFGRPGVAILSPYDARSVVWDIGADCRTQTDALALASVLAAGGGTSGSTGAQADFFQQASTTVLAAALETLQSNYGTAWGWDTFVAMFSADRDALLSVLVAAGHPEVVELIGSADAKSASVMATIGNAIALARTLARAWPYDPNRPEAERWSVRAWAADGYDGPHVILAKGDDFPDTMGRALVAATNMLALTTTSLPDNERGRLIAVVADELAALRARLDIASLVAVGRSKGVVCVLGLQDLHQLVPIYGPEVVKALASMVGLHIVGRTNMGATRDEIAQHIGERVVSVRAHGPNAGPAQETAVPVVRGAYISHDLGPFGRIVIRRKGKTTIKRAKGVRLLVHGLGPNVLRLEWPIEDLPRRAAPLVRAAWTQRPVGAPPAPEPAPVPVAPVDPVADLEALAQPDAAAVEHDAGPILPPAAPEQQSEQAAGGGWEWP